MGDTWLDVRQVSKTINRTKRIRIRGENILFPASVIGGEKERDPMILSQILGVPLVGIFGPRVKVHLLDEGYTYVPKSWDFIENPKEEIWGKSKAQAWELFLRLSTHYSTLQEVEILPTLVYFHPKGLILGEMLCRGPKSLFG